jgi:hypothetical protein
VVVTRAANLGAPWRLKIKKLLAPAELLQARRRRHRCFAARWLPIGANRRQCCGPNLRVSATDNYDLG